MDENLDRRLEQIHERLEAIESNTRTTWKELLLAGLLRGVGIIIGSAVTLALAGWGLAVLGIIPGAEEMAEYLTDVFTDSVNDAL